MLVVPEGAYFSAQDIDDTLSEVQERQVRGLTALNKIVTGEHVEQLLQTAMLRRVVELFIHSTHETVRDAAIWVLTNLAAMPGDRGAAAVWGSGPPLHRAMVQAATLGARRIMSETFWCLANIAGSGPLFATDMIHYNLHTIALGVISDPSTGGRLRKNAVFLLGNLAPHLDERVAAVLLDQLTTLPPVIFTDNVSMVDLLWAIHVLQYRAQNIANISCAVLVERLSHEETRMINPALLTIDNICAGTNRDLIKELLRVGVVGGLHRLLRRRLFAGHVLRTFSNLAVEIEGADVIVRTSGLLYDINAYVRLSTEALWVLCNLATRGLPRHVRAMIGCGSPTALLQMAVPTVDELRLRLVVEGLLAILQKDGVAAQQFLGALGFEARIQVLNEHESDYIRRHVGEILDVWRGLGVPTVPPAAVAALPPAAFAVAMVGRYTISPQTRMAIDRVVEESGRGEGERWVSVSDLIFTAADVAYLTGLGYAFDIEGRVGLNDAAYALRSSGAALN